jgi:hypothetical protein
MLKPSPNRHCSAQRLIGKPGKMWGECTLVGVHYRKRKWYCAEHFVPFPAKPVREKKSGKRRLTRREPAF